MVRWMVCQRGVSGWWVHTGTYVGSWRGGGGRGVGRVEGAVRVGCLLACLVHMRDCGKMGWSSQGWNERIYVNGEVEAGISKDGLELGLARIFV